MQSQLSSLTKVTTSDDGGLSTKYGVKLGSGSFVVFPGQGLEEDIDPNLRLPDEVRGQVAKVPVVGSTNGLTGFRLVRNTDEIPARDLKNGVPGKNERAQRGETPSEVGHPDKHDKVSGEVLKSAPNTGSLKIIKDGAARCLEVALHEKGTEVLSDSQDSDDAPGVSADVPKLHDNRDSAEAPQVSDEVRKSVPNAGSLKLIKDDAARCLAQNACDPPSKNQVPGFASQAMALLCLLVLLVLYCSNQASLTCADTKQPTPAESLNTDAPASGLPSNQDSHERRSSIAYKPLLWCLMPVGSGPEA